MRTNRNSLVGSSRRRDVCVASGFGIRVRVERNHLLVEDGSGRHRRTRRFARATHRLSRLVVIGREGYITLGAIRWLADTGIRLVHLDRDGNVLASSDSGGGDARLRRQQALATQSPLGLEIARYLLGEKVEGQRQNLDLLPPTPAAKAAIAEWAERVSIGTSLDELLEAEREAAAHYWSCWADVPVRFARRDLARIPEHWLRVGARHSPLTTSSRVAITPANALLNYLYAILEAEARIACLTLGLDPGLGIWHADYRARDSLVLDLMEAGRPAVDRYVLDLIRRRTFTRSDFGETSRGVCRLLPLLAEELAQTSSVWRDAIAPHAEHVAELLALAPGSRVNERLATPLTRRNRSAAQEPKRRPRRLQAQKLVRRCRRCDAPVPHPDRTYCDTCLSLPPRGRRASTTEGHDETTVSRTSRRCKACGAPVPHRKRVYCDECFAEYEQRLAAVRRGCARCGARLPHRKRTYCDACLALGVTSG